MCRRAPNPWHLHTDTHEWHDSKSFMECFRVPCVSERESQSGQAKREAL